MTAALNVSDLRKQFAIGRPAVDGLSFDVEAGETVGVVGESGCGKTMAAMSIMRLLPRGGFIAGGQIRLNGRDLVPISEEEIRKVRGDDIGGIAVHIGARVSALAEPNDVLVSSTLRDLVIGSGIQFEERGSYELKGVPGEWRLFAVAAT